MSRGLHRKPRRTSDRTRTNERWPHGDVLLHLANGEDPLKTPTWRAPAPRWRRNPPVGFIRPCGLVRRLALLRRKRSKATNEASAPTRLVMSAPKSLRPSFRSPPRQRSAPRGQLDREPPRSMTASCRTSRASACSQPGPAGGGSTSPIEARREALMRLVAGVNGILFSGTLAAEGAIVFTKARELRPRGHWLKTKEPDFVRT